MITDFQTPNGRLNKPKKPMSDGTKFALVALALLAVVAIIRFSQGVCLATNPINYCM